MKFYRNHKLNAAVSEHTNYLQLFKEYLRQQWGLRHLRVVIVKILKILSYAADLLTVQVWFEVHQWTVTDL